MTGKGLSTNDYTDADVAALAGKANAADVTASLALKADQADLVSGLAGKVDAEEGKGLSTEDYTTAEKTKLAGITAGAEPNVQSDWTASSTSDAYIRNKPTIPSASSATPLTNGTASAGSSANYSRADHVHPRDSFDADEISYQIGSSSEIPVSQALDELYEVAGGPSPTSTTPAMDGTAAVGTETSYARGDHVHPTDTSRAPIASPTFTGTPKAPTAAMGTDTTQLATTAFVQDAIENLALSFRIDGADLVVDY